jgi:hypothetical protein
MEYNNDWPVHTKIIEPINVFHSNASKVKVL